MSFWTVAVLESVPVRLCALSVRMMGWLVVFSSLVIWWGPGAASGDPGRAFIGLVVGCLVWSLGVMPRWLAIRAGAGRA